MMVLAAISVFYGALLVDNVQCFILNNKASQVSSLYNYTNLNAKKWKNNNSSNSSMYLIGNKKKVKLKKTDTLSHNVRQNDRNFVNSKKSSKILAAIQSGRSSESEFPTTCIYQLHWKNNSDIIVTNSTRSPFFRRIHSTLTRSKDAVWATISLTFICVVLLVAVAHSRMWKDHRISDMNGVPLPMFNERVPFKEVVEHKMKQLKQFVKKKKKSERMSSMMELESLLSSNEQDSQ